MKEREIKKYFPFIQYDGSILCFSINHITYNLLHAASFAALMFIFQKDITKIELSQIKFFSSFFVWYLKNVLGVLKNEKREKRRMKDVT